MRLCLTEPHLRRCLSVLPSDDRPVDERYLMRAERKRRRKLARQTRVLNVGRYSGSALAVGGDAAGARCFPAIALCGIWDCLF